MVSQEKLMRILHIDTGTVWRGGQRQVLTLHKGLLEQGIESLLLCNQSGALYQTCEVEQNPAFHGFDFHGEYSRKTHKQLKELIEAFNPTIIHCHDSHAVKLGDRFHRYCPLFHTRRVSYPIKFLSRFFKYRNISMHICVSEDIRKYMQQYFPHTTTIHSCIDLNRFNRPSDPDIFNTPGEINLLYVGAFTEQKGIDILIHAFASICKQHPNSVLHLVGDGTLFSEIEQLIHALGINKQTRLYGARTDIEDFYLNSDLVICPSVSGEGSSGVIKEGLAAGKIVIASDLEANKELIHQDINGLLFENRNHESLAATLLQALSNRHSITTTQIQQSITPFDCSNTIQQHINLYRSTLHSMPETS